MDAEIIVQLRTGESIPFNPKHEAALFLSILGAVLGHEYHAQCKLCDWNGVCQECQLELEFVSGQLLALKQHDAAKNLRESLPDWLCEFEAEATRPPYE